MDDGVSRIVGGHLAAGDHSPATLPATPAAATRRTAVVVLVTGAVAAVLSAGFLRVVVGAPRLPVLFLGDRRLAARSLTAAVLAVPLGPCLAADATLAATAAAAATPSRNAARVLVGAAILPGPGLLGWLAPDLGRLEDKNWWLERRSRHGLRARPAAAARGLRRT